MGLTKVAITRPIFILMMMCLAVFGGIFAISKMRQEENPEVQFGVVTVSTVYPGAGPDEVSTLVSRRIEDSISGVNGLLEITSTSQEAVSVVVANFEVGTNMDVALNDVRARVDQIIGNLPKDALRPSISKIDGASDPVMVMAVSSSSLNPERLRDLTDDKIKDQFARLKGVGQVSISGGEEREIQVRIKKDRLLSYGIGIMDVQRAISAATLNLPSGRINSGDEEVSVRVLGEFKTLDDIRNTVIRVNDGRDPDAGATFRLGDVAEVTDSVKELREYSRVGGNPSIVMTVQKAKEGNAVEVADGIKATIPKVEKEFGVKFTVTEDKSIRVKESVFDLLLTLFIGVFLVTAIVYIFLHNFRGTMIVGIAIPVCLLAAFMVLAILGFTMNNMSLLAMSLAIGVLVDDSIVVLENIYRHLQMGESPVEAAINGRGEIGLAAIAITLADVVVFLPMGFMGGVVGQFFKPLGIGFAVAVMLSLFVSFTVTPMLASRWYKEGEDVEGHESRFANWFNGRFRKLENGYASVLERALRNRWFVFISGFVSLIAVFMFIGGGSASNIGDAIKNTLPMMQNTVTIGLIAFVVTLLFTKHVRWRILWGAALFALVFPLASGLGHLYGSWKQEAMFKFEFAPSTDQGLVTITAEMSPSATLAQTLDVTKRLEQIAMKHPDVETITSRVGVWTGQFGGGGGSRGTNLAEIRVKLHEKKAILDSFMFWVHHEKPLRTRTDRSIVADFIKSIGKVPGAKVRVSAISGFGFGAPIQMSFASDDRALLAKTVNTIVDRLKAGEIKGVISPESSSKPGKPELRAIPIRDRMAESGMTTADIAASMRMLYEGNDDVKFRELGREYPIRVMMDLADRNNPDLVESVPVTFSRGNPVFLPQVANLDSGTTVDKVERRNRQEEIRITTDLLTGYAPGTVQAEIDEWLKKEALVPEGVKIKPLGQADVQAREMGYMMTTFMIGFVLVYMVLASLYDNLIYPFIIQLAQPQAFVGALLALVLTDKALNIVSMIGLIALVGLVGKNAILLVDYTNTLRARGEDRHTALVEAGRTRLRPIMMTTLAVILGMLPVALAVGRGSEFRETLGIVIIGGITLSTLLTLLVIPAAYTVFDDLSQRFAGPDGNGASPRRLLRKKKKAVEEQEYVG